MRTRRRTALPTACLLATFAAGCAHNPAPRGWLSRPEVAASEAFGAWLEIQADSARHELRYEGEFIGAQADSIYLLGDEGFEGVSRARILRARLIAYDARAGELAGWTFLGTVGTLSHGVGLIFTAPTWILVGSLASSAQSRNPMVRVPPNPWKEATKYARFPQGLPENLDRASLARKR